MVVPGEVIADGNTEVFGVLDLCKIYTVQVVDGLPLVFSSCYVYDDAFVRVESHLPVACPLTKSIEVGLQVGAVSDAVSY